MSERSELVSLPDRHTAVMGTPKGQRLRSPFLGLLSFGEAKESNSPAGAKPGLVVRKAAHKKSNTPCRLDPVKSQPSHVPMAH
jgi:hypothetical protein